MSRTNPFVRALVASLAVVVFLATAASAAEGKFRAASGHEPVIGRYLVTLDGSVDPDVAASSAEALARSYGAQWPWRTRGDCPRHTARA